MIPLTTADALLRTEIERCERGEAEATAKYFEGMRILEVWPQGRHDILDVKVDTTRAFNKACEFAATKATVKHLLQGLQHYAYEVADES